MAGKKKTPAAITTELEPVEFVPAVLVTNRAEMKSIVVGGLTLSEIESMVRRDAFISPDEATATIKWTQNEVFWHRREDKNLFVVAKNDRVQYEFLVIMM